MSGLSADDYVRKDGVIKEQVSLEDSVRRRYNEKWAFLQDFHQMSIEIAAERGISLNKYQEGLRKLAVREQERFGPMRRFHGLRDDQLQFKQKNIASIKVAEPSGVVPILSSGMVGWRSSRLECSLEKVGPLYVSRKHSLPPIEPYNPPTTFILG